MKESDIRSQLEEVRTALKANEDEHEVLVSLLKGYEGWLRLRGDKNGASQLQMTVVAEIPPKKGKLKGTVSFRSAVLKAVQDARGEPLHVREILSRARAQGAITAAKDPEGITDLMCYSLKDHGEPLKKVAGRTWAWAD
jgi:hypothetical protein